MSAPALPPPVVGLMCALTQRALTPGAPAPTGARRLLSRGLLLGAVATAGSAAGIFQRVGTTVDPHHPERSNALVDSGPFALTRNPMYVGMATLLTAHAVRRGSPLALLPVAAFVAWIDRLQVPVEEQALRATFGAAYDDYCARVPRWLPTPG